MGSASMYHDFKMPAVRMGERCTLDEDVRIEFKMHTKLSLLEIPARCQTYDRGRLVRTMQPTSKTISAFLNTDGGTIYIGIGDNAVIYGIQLTPAMKDHFILSLSHCLSRFTPPVPSGLVHVKFIEMQDLGDDQNTLSSQISSSYITSADGELVNPDEAEFMKLLTKEGPHHHLIGAIACPCERFEQQAKLYLIVVEVYRSPDGTIYQNEEGLAYRRRHGSNQMMTINDADIFIRSDRIIS